VAGITIRVRSAETARKAILLGSGLDLPMTSESRGLAVLVPSDTHMAFGSNFWNPRRRPKPHNGRMHLTARFARRRCCARR
jgi:hypothetical protein